MDKSLALLHLCSTSFGLHQPPRLPLILARTHAAKAAFVSATPGPPAIVSRVLFFILMWRPTIQVTPLAGVLCISKSNRRTSWIMGRMANMLGRSTGLMLVFEIRMGTRLRRRRGRRSVCLPWDTGLAALLAIQGDWPLIADHTGFDITNKLPAVFIVTPGALAGWYWLYLLNLLCTKKSLECSSSPSITCVCCNLRAL